jgi:hypothetical protein
VRDKDLEKVKELVAQFSELWQAERATRSELDQIGKEIKYYTREFEKTDKDVTNGIRYVSDLRSIGGTLKRLRESRDKISDKLQQAVEAVETKRESLRPAVNKILYDRYRELSVKEKDLLSTAIVIQKISAILSLQAGLDYSMRLMHSPVCNGQSITLTEKDTDLFEQLIKEDKNGEN